MLEKFLHPRPSEIASYFGDKEKEIQLLVICGPSGVGKSTIVSMLLEKHPNFSSIYAYTDRPSRLGEKKSCISPERFDEMLNDGRFLLSYEAYGYRYGNTAKSIREATSQGKGLILSYPIQHLKNLTVLKDYIGGGAKVVYLLPPSLEELKRRLKTRPDRFREARNEIHTLSSIQQRRKIDTFLVNNNISDVILELERILDK